MDFPTRGAAYLAGNIMQESSWDGARPPVEIARRAESGMVPIIIWMYEWVCMVHSHSGSAPVTLRWYELVCPPGVC